MVGIRSRMAAVAAGAVLAAAGLWAQGAAAPRGTVNGTVVRAGAPVGGVKFELVSTVSSYKPTLVTDGKGAVSFPQTPVGRVELRATDAKGTVIGSATGVLTTQGEVVSLVVTVP